MTSDPEIYIAWREYRLVVVNLKIIISYVNFLVCEWGVLKRQITNTDKLYRTKVVRQWTIDKGRPKIVSCVSQN